MPRKAATQQSKVDPSRAALVDELAEIEPQARAAKKLIDRAETLRRTIRNWADADGKKAHETMLVLGQHFQAQIGPHEDNRIVNNAAAFTALGKQEFLSRAILYPKALEHLPADVQDKIVRREPIAARSVTISPRS